ncbi:hypothetical protein [Microbacterium thalli]|uniref:hypothetical protein n=1 Tax=Microbacterium thalli TaxID=3027921 RepID=UPI002365299C|nr:hypothetical protein [Microbacterium thalli]MDD7930113.1 hypothetical protein [Microbacterium thalli]
MTEIKPAAFNRAYPAGDSNSFYGIEDELVELPAGEQLITISTWVVEDVPTKQRGEQTYPLLKQVHIELLHVPDAITAALKLRDAAYKKRTGQDALAIVDGEDSE